MQYIQALIALLPVFSKLLDLFIKTPEEKRKEFIAQLPDQLREISDAINKAESKKDPSDISRIINS